MGGRREHTAHEPLSAAVMVVEVPLTGLSFSVLGQRDGNAVCARLPEPLAAGLRAHGWRFYDFIGSGGCRFMCSWSTTDADIDALL